PEKRDFEGFAGLHRGTWEPWTRPSLPTSRRASRLSSFAVQSRGCPGINLRLPLKALRPVDKPVATQLKASCIESRAPTLAGADGGGLVEETMPLLLAREASELGTLRVIRAEERLLAVQDRRVRDRRVVEAIDLARAKRQLNAALQRGMGVVLK